MQEFLQEVREKSQELEKKSQNGQSLSLEELEYQFLLSLLCEEGDASKKSK